MRSFQSEVLSTAGEDKRKWSELVSNAIKKDIYFTPEYAMVLERTEGKVKENFGTWNSAVPLHRVKGCDFGS